MNWDEDGYEVTLHDETDEMIHDRMFRSLVSARRYAVRQSKKPDIFEAIIKPTDSDGWYYYTNGKEDV